MFWIETIEIVHRCSWVIPWYDLIHSTWYSTPGQVTIIIMCMYRTIPGRITSQLLSYLNYVWIETIEIVHRCSWVIPWYDLIHTTWYSTPGQVTIIIMCMYRTIPGRITSQLLSYLNYVWIETIEIVHRCSWVIPWYDLIHTTWYSTPGQVTIIIMCMYRTIPGRITSQLLSYLNYVWIETIEIVCRCSFIWNNCIIHLIKLSGTADYCKFRNFRENLIFWNSVKRHICGVKIHDQSTVYLYQ